MKNQKISTTNMKVTSVRISDKTINSLKKLSNGSYQNLMRKILDSYVLEHDKSLKNSFKLEDILYYIEATSNIDTFCFITGKPIKKTEAIYLGVTKNNNYLSVKIDSIKNNKELTLPKLIDQQENYSKVK